MTMESRAWNQDVSRAVLPLKALGKTLSASSLSHAHPWCPLPCSVITPTSASSSHGRKKSTLMSLIRTIIPSRGPTLISQLNLVIFQRLHLQTPSHCGAGVVVVRASACKFGGTQPSFHNRSSLKQKKDWNIAFITNKSWSRLILTYLWSFRPDAI